MPTHQQVNSLVVKSSTHGSFSFSRIEWIPFLPKTWPSRPLKGGEGGIQRFLPKCLNHTIIITPIDRYSLKKLMFSIPVGYDFTLAIYAVYIGLSMNYSSPLKTDVQALIISQECKYTYFVKTGLFLQKSCWIEEVSIWDQKIFKKAISESCSVQ